MQADPDRLEVVRKDGKIYSHVRKRYLVETPEETVRQEYLTTLVNDYGYSLDQISEEEDTTGDEDLNELFPNVRQPEGTEGMTALEVYCDFRSNPTAYLLGQEPKKAQNEPVEVEA